MPKFLIFLFLLLPMVSLAQPYHPYLPDSILTYNVSIKDTSLKTPLTKTTFSYNLNGMIEKSSYYKFNPKTRQFELRSTRAYQYIGNDVIERETNRFEGKEVLNKIRTFQFNQKKQVTQLLSEKALSNSNQMAMDTRIEFNYEKDSLRSITEYKNSTTIYKQHMKIYQWQKNQLVILGKEMNEVDASVKRNYKIVFKLNGQGDILSQKEEQNFPIKPSVYHGFYLDKANRISKDTLKTIDEKKKLTSTLSIAQWSYHEKKNQAVQLIFPSNKNAESTSSQATMEVIFNTSRSNSKRQKLIAYYLEDFILYE